MSDKRLSDVTKKFDERKKPPPRVTVNELSDEELDKVSSGAVDAFIWFETAGQTQTPRGETKD